jgi:hypothetical protein
MTIILTGQLGQRLVLTKQNSFLNMDRGVLSIMQFYFQNVTLAAVIFCIMAHALSTVSLCLPADNLIPLAVIIAF